MSKNNELISTLKGFQNDSSIPKELKDKLLLLAAQFISNDYGISNRFGLEIVIDLITKFSEMNRKLNKYTELVEVNQRFGIHDYVPKLEDSNYEPKACMANSSINFSFMGILGYKYIIDAPTKTNFEKFLRRIQKNKGKARFLLINSKSQAFDKLTELRGEHMQDHSTSIFRNMVNKFPSLEVKLYDHLPFFRLAFIDDKELAISRYHFEEEVYSTTNYGWDDPHLIIRPRTNDTFNHSLYEPFANYFKMEWNNAKDIAEIF